MSQCTLCYFISSEMKFTLNITKLFAFSQLNTLSIWNYSARSYQGPSASSLHFQQVASHIRLTHSTNVPGDMTSTNLFSNILSFDIDSIELNCIKKKGKKCAENQMWCSRSASAHTARIRVLITKTSAVPCYLTLEWFWIVDTTETCILTAPDLG